MADIYAVQTLYGERTTRSESTTYGFNCTAGAIFDFSQYFGTPAFTIYDSGGTDTLDCSGYSNSQMINLQSGTWSSIGGFAKNVAIYLTTVIENAVGGSGTDTILTNSADNSVDGRGGSDQAVLTYVYGSGYTISGTPDALNIAGANGNDWFFDVESFEFSGGLRKTALELLGLPPALPDLIVTNLSISTPIFESGQLVDVSYTFGNQGTASAGSSTTYFYLSVDATLDESDTFIDLEFEFAIAAGGTRAITSTVYLPYDMPTEETFYLIAVADDSNFVEEVTEDNNVSNSVSVRIPAPAPPPAPPPDDFGDTIATTGRVQIGRSSSGSIETVEDADWFAVTLVMGHTYRFDLEGAATGRGTLSDPYLMLRNGSGVVLREDDDSGAGLNSTLEFSAGRTGTFYLSVHPFDLSTGTYRVSLSDISSSRLFTNQDDIVGLTLTDVEWHGLGGNDRISGMSTRDVIHGDAGGDTLRGENGNDGLFGNVGKDSLDGGNGADRLTGGLGRDLMTGGNGVDVFYFSAVAEIGNSAADRDKIADFTHLTDRIDLSPIDANGTASGNTAFKFLAAKGAAFTGAKGQLHWLQTGGNTIIEGDIDGNRVADFKIELTGLKSLTATDFIL